VELTWFVLVGVDEREVKMEVRSALGFGSAVVILGGDGGSF
jgi:hypothetical protein